MNMTQLIARLNESHQRIARMCAEGRGPRMQIPVNPDDDDLFICAAISDAKAEVALAAHLRTSLTTALAERDALHAKYVDAATECAAWKMACTLAKEERDEACNTLKEVNGRARRLQSKG